MDMTRGMTYEASAGQQLFAFGANWARFLSQLSDDRIKIAEESLQRLLQRERLDGCRFLDAGSGSGLFSLAAHRLGASVFSFDVDPDSIACTQELRRRYGNDSDSWQLSHGSLLDQKFLSSLGVFDIIYCWGVAHHSGNMWKAIDNLLPLVKPGGKIVLAIYNDQLYLSRFSRAIKQIYQRLPVFLRPFYVFLIGSLSFIKRLSVTIAASLLRLLTLRNPFVPLVNWTGETQSRGMHGWYDLVDWVGGWPFEVARPEEIFRFARDRGFELKEMTTSIGHGCNEFVFARKTN